MLAGGVATFVFAIACLHFRPIAFLHETFTLSHQRGGITGQAVTTFVEDIGELVFTLVAGLAVANVRFVNRRIAGKYVLATVVIAGCDIFCRATNAMHADLPLAAFWCLSGAIVLLSAPAAAEAATGRRQRMIALLVLCPIALPIFLMDFSSSVYAAFKTAAIRNHALLRFDSARLRNWVPQDWLGEDPNYVSRNGKSLILATNDGIHLLQSLSRQDEQSFVSLTITPSPLRWDGGRRKAGRCGFTWVTTSAPVIPYPKTWPSDIPIYSWWNSQIIPRETQQKQSFRSIPTC
jgi:hypothetical protein